MSKTSGKGKGSSKSKAVVPAQAVVSGDFDEVLRLIDAARARAFASVNHELVDLYWQVGGYISHKIESAAWGEKVVQQLAANIARRRPDLRGFTRSNLLRMRQFYETYRGDEKVAPLVRQLPWTHNLLVLGRSKRPEEREPRKPPAAQLCRNLWHNCLQPRSREKVARNEQAFQIIGVNQAWHVH